jgi:SAM-dependent methyltransferase
VQADFDRIASLPQARWDQNSHYHGFLLNHVPPHCDEVLEIGCGAGAFSRLLARRSEHVVALDFSPQMIRVARERSVEYPNIDYFIEEAQKYKFPVGKLDCIVSIATLHHLPFEEMLLKCKAALRPNGVLLVLDLYQASGLADWAISALARPVNAVLKLVKLGRWQDSEEAQAAWDAHGAHDSYMTLAQIRQVCAAVLPGAQIKRHLLWRYSIIWNKT